MSQFILGITGKKQAGKDTAAQLIKKYLKEFAAIESLARPLKNIIEQQFGVPHEVLYGDNKEEYMVSIDRKRISLRVLMQKLGEGMKVCLWEDIHIDLLKDRLKKVPAPVIIVSDIRFPHEAAWVKETGGMVIKIIGKRTATDIHCSENQTIEADVTIDNTGSLDKLELSIINNVLPLIKISCKEYNGHILTNMESIVQKKETEGRIPFALERASYERIFGKRD